MIKIEEAIRKRDEFLEKRPHLKKFQKEIDEVLSKCINPQKKLEVLTLMIIGKLVEMQLTIKELTNIKKEGNGTDSSM